MSLFKQGAACRCSFRALLAFYRVEAMDGVKDVELVAFGKTTVLVNHTIVGTDMSAALVNTLLLAINQRFTESFAFGFVFGGDAFVFTIEDEFDGLVGALGLAKIFVNMTVVGTPVHRLPFVFWTVVLAVQNGLFRGAFFLALFFSKFFARENTKKFNILAFSSTLIGIQIAIRCADLILVDN
jgi:hypothetical protein